MSRGRIRKALSGFYYVEVDGRTVTCRARGKFRQEGRRETAPGEGTVWEIEPRRTVFDRPAVANVDQLVVVASQAVPVTDPFLIDRVSAIAALKNCGVVVCVNKCDLKPGEEMAAIYRAAGFSTVCTSAETGEGIAELTEHLRGKLSAFTGNSGVGKSSLLNAVEPDFSLRVAEVSEKLGRGKHTTRHVELYRLQCGGEVIDTPGFSSFDTQELDLELKEHLAESFIEFRPYLADCRFVGCSHTREKGCAVLKAVKEGKIPYSRHQSYVRLYGELKAVKAWEKR